MQNYELLLILPGTLSENEVDPLIEKVSKIIEEAGASNFSVVKLEKRRLAYPIKHIRYGYFNLAYFEAEPEVVVDIQNKLRLIPELLRALTQKYDPTKQTSKTIEFGHPLQGQHKDDRIAESGRTVSRRGDVVNKRDNEEPRKAVEQKEEVKDDKEAVESKEEKEEVAETVVEVAEEKIVEEKAIEEDKTEEKEEVVVEESKEEPKEEKEEVKEEVVAPAKSTASKKAVDMADIDKKLDEILDLDLSDV